MSWNYRLIRVGNEIQLHEVYYDVITKEPSFRTEIPPGFIYDEGENGILLLEQITDAFNKPILDDEIFEGKTPF